MSDRELRKAALDAAIQWLKNAKNNPDLQDLGIVFQEFKKLLGGK